MVEFISEDGTEVLLNELRRENLRLRQSLAEVSDGYAQWGQEKKGLLEGFSHEVARLEQEIKTYKAVINYWWPLLGYKSPEEMVYPLSDDVRAYFAPALQELYDFQAASKAIEGNNNPFLERMRYYSSLRLELESKLKTSQEALAKLNSTSVSLRLHLSAIVEEIRENRGGLRTEWSDWLKGAEQALAQP